MKETELPIVICNWCQYVGQGKYLEDKWADAEKHEETCPQKEDD